MGVLTYFVLLEKMLSIERLPACEVDLKKEEELRRVADQLSELGLEQITNHLILEKREKKIKLKDGNLVLDEPFYGRIVNLEVNGKAGEYYLRCCDLDFSLVDNSAMRFLMRKGYTGVFSIGPGVFDSKERDDILLAQIFIAQNTLLGLRVSEIAERNFNFFLSSENQRSDRTHLLICACSIKEEATE